MILILTPRIRSAIRFAINTHDVHQKQTRKGKTVAYVTHPITVGLILARAGASENVIIAGILHDTIEDSVPDKKVTREMIAEQFGESVAVLVESVTEPPKDIPWEERKKEALEHLETFSHDSLLVKSADVLSNGSELVDDYKEDGEGIFIRFNAPKAVFLNHYLRTIKVILRRWPESPLAGDLKRLSREMEGMVGGI